ncbi:hypothetical protein FHL15_002330 [Xylaria flabelliformis]|uniref:Uncharacterized protein n=1 Tax=Xylaria flabelliformis TaxID=2512241 RepID=A0A553IA04_9PEZI|nr:hypothetical protein FHL15_002330 [Xylaria flabelliformis]
MWLYASLLPRRSVRVQIRAKSEAADGPSQGHGPAAGTYSLRFTNSTIPGYGSPIRSVAEPYAVKAVLEKPVAANAESLMICGGHCVSMTQVKMMLLGGKGALKRRKAKPIPSSSVTTSGFLIITLEYKHYPAHPPVISELSPLASTMRMDFPKHTWRGTILADWAEVSIKTGCLMVRSYILTAGHQSWCRLSQARAPKYQYCKRAHTTKHSPS